MSEQAEKAWQGMGPQAAQLEAKFKVWWKEWWGTDGGCTEEYVAGAAWRDGYRTCEKGPLAEAEQLMQRASALYGELSIGLPIAGILDSFREWNKEWSRLFYQLHEADPPEEEQDAPE